MSCACFGHRHSPCFNYLYRHRSNSNHFNVYSYNGSEPWFEPFTFFTMSDCKAHKGRIPPKQNLCLLVSFKERGWKVVLFSQKWDNTKYLKHKNTIWILYTSKFYFWEYFFIFGIFLLNLRYFRNNFYGM